MEMPQKSPVAQKINRPRNANFFAGKHPDSCVADYVRFYGWASSLRWPRETQKPGEAVSSLTYLTFNGEGSESEGDGY